MDSKEKDIYQKIQQIKPIKTLIELIEKSYDDYCNVQKKCQSKIIEFDNKKKEYNNQKRKDEAEKLLDQLEDLKTRNKIINESFINYLNKTDEIKLIIQELMSNFENEKEICEKKKGEFGEFIINYHNKLMNEQLKHHNIHHCFGFIPMNIQESYCKSKTMENQINLTSCYQINLNDSLNGKSEKEKNRINPFSYYQNNLNHSLNGKSEKENSNKEIPQQQQNQKLRLLVPQMKPSPIPQMKQLEEWTQKKYGEILFDSDINEWSNPTILNEKINGREKLIFLIEDEDGEKFGYYLNTQKEKHMNEIKTDSGSFHFNLESNGRLETPMKFEIKDINNGGIMIFENSCGFLIKLGDIVVFNKEYKHISSCQQNENIFDYHEIKDALCGKTIEKGSTEHFVPKRIPVIQMQ